MHIKTPYSRIPHKTQSDQYFINKVGLRYSKILNKIIDDIIKNTDGNNPPLRDVIYYDFHELFGDVKIDDISVKHVTTFLNAFGYRTYANLPKFTITLTPDY